jgi:tRNA threonylcarbamoyladenosine biosynthesis protein TsaB
MPTDDTLFVIDTAGEQCSLALARGGLVDLVRGVPGHTHLEHVMPMIERLFARHELAPAQCAAFAFGSGPGSFTGLRVACTIVQGLAFGAGRPVIAVGNLHALAACVDEGASPARPWPRRPRRVMAALDARMNQAYVAVFEGSGTVWRALLSPCLVDVGQLPAIAAQWQPDYCGGDAAWLERAWGADGLPGGLSRRDATVDAAVIARLALERLARGEVLAPERALPEYVRNDVARTVAQRRAAIVAGAP